MRVDIRAEFYVRVDGSDEGIALAGQTLGDRVNDPTAIQDLVEAKLVDALRSVAALNTLDELHENRATFIKAVQDAVESDLRSNGLELETVSPASTRRRRNISTRPMPSTQSALPA